MKMDFDEIIGATSYFVLFEIMKVTLMVDFELFGDGYGLIDKVCPQHPLGFFELLSLY